MGANKEKSVAEIDLPLQTGADTFPSAPVQDQCDKTASTPKKVCADFSEIAIPSNVCAEKVRARYSTEKKPQKSLVQYYNSAKKPIPKVNQWNSMCKSIDSLKWQIKDKMLEGLLIKLKRIPSPYKTQSASTGKRSHSAISRTTISGKSAVNPIRKVKRRCDECIKLMSRGISCAHCPHHP